jgi:hypothetical protein
VRTDVVGAHVGDEAQVERSRGVDRARLPVRRSRRAHVDLLAAEPQRHPALAPEHLALHAEHPHVPVGGGVDVTGVEHNMVDSIHAQGHTSRYCR